VIALLFLSSLIDLRVGVTVGVAFFVSMLLLMGCLVTSIAEVRLAICLLYVLCLLNVICLLYVSASCSGLE
jgi:hypothetical protein